MSRIGVAVRIRPLLDQEKTSNLKSKLIVDSSSGTIKILTDDHRNLKVFRFDRVFDGKSSQQEVYKDVSIDDLVQKGYNSTIFAYGQTGSGKTYTMEGYKYEYNQDKVVPVIQNESPNIGVIPRSIKSLFEIAKNVSKDQGRLIRIRCSFLQLYNEKIFDLLNPTQLGKMNTNAQGLRIRWSAKEEFEVENLFIFECKNAEECLEYYNCGVKNKIIASHKLNIASSRSHTIFTIKIESIDIKNHQDILHSRLDLVDLAGSERISWTGNDTKEGQKETIEINKSLFILKKVINSLNEIQKAETQEKKEKIYVPYRESKLTCLLRSSIGGNGYCLMLACLSPSDKFFEENVQTMTYAMLAGGITNQPVKNDDPNMKVINDLKKQIKRLTNELGRANDEIMFLSKFNQKRNDENTDPGSTIEKTMNQTDLSTLRKFSITPKSTEIKKSEFNSTGLSYDVKSPEALHQRLIDSINTVRELLATNKELCETIEKQSYKIDSLTSENYQLKQENQDLRDRIIAYNQYGRAWNDTRSLMSIDDMDSHHDNPQTYSNQDMMKELLKLRNMKKNLENRVQSLEIENTELTQKVYPKTYHLKEPKKSVYEIPQNIYEMSQVIKAKTRKDSAHSSVQTPSEKRAISVSPRRILEKLPEARTNTPRNQMEINVGLTKMSRNGYPKQLKPLDEEGNGPQYSTLNNSSFMNEKDDSISKAFRRNAPKHERTFLKRPAPTHSRGPNDLILITFDGNHNSREDIKDKFEHNTGQD